MPIQAIEAYYAVPLFLGDNMNNFEKIENLVLDNPGVKPAELTGIMGIDSGACWSIINSLVKSDILSIEGLDKKRRLYHKSFTFEFPSHRVLGMAWV